MSITDYDRAYRRVLAAQTQRDDLPAAHAELAEATRPLRVQVDAAYEANRRAVQDAKAAGVAALREWARVEVEVGEAARRRWLAAGGVGLCVLTDDEAARVDAARVAVDATLVAHETAKARFKAGVRPEQLET